MKKVLFIDRDGTLVIEPPVDLQLDSLEKLEFYPGVFQGLSQIVRELDYDLVMVTNQDGLGTASFPEDTFWPAHNKMLQAFKNEGITFSEIIIDRSFPNENLPTRKPGTALLNHFIKGNYDLANSYVIGDRLTDVQLAENLGCKSVFIGTECQTATLVTQDWEAIYRHLKQLPRAATVNRKTNETNISITINLDGTGQSNINTGLGFFDHMLNQLCRHSLIDIEIDVKGDQHIDDHHSVEDTGIALGQAISKALGERRGIVRYASLDLAMDETMTKAAIDISGRPFLVWTVKFSAPKIGTFDTELVREFFQALAQNAGITLHVLNHYGANNHHIAETCFKAVARVLRASTEIDPRQAGRVPSTKGMLV